MEKEKARKRGRKEMMRVERRDCEKGRDEEGGEGEDDAEKEMIKGETRKDGDESERRQMVGKR